MNNRPSSVAALPDFVCQRYGRTKTINIAGVATEAVSMRVKKSNDPRVLSGSTFLLADSSKSSQPELRYTPKTAATTIRLNTSRKKKLSEGEVLVLNKDAGVVMTTPNAFSGERIR